MGIKIESKERKVNLVKNRKYSLSSLLLIFSLIFVIFFINGCARWPDGPNGGNGTGQKLLVIRVDINENGAIKTADGHYYIVFNTKENAESPPSKDIDDWEEGFYYVKLDNYGFCFGQWGSSCHSTGIGNASTKYFQVNIDLESLGNPERILMNIITTNNDDKTYDYIDNSSELTIIDTDLSDYNKIVTDFSSDSTGGGPDFDIIKVSTSLIVS